MIKKNKNKVRTEQKSISAIFAKKYIYYYYAFFWIILILFLLIK